MCFSLIGEVVESKVKAVAVKMGLGTERVCFDTIIPKERIPFDFETSQVYRWQKQDLYFSKIYINFMLSIKSNEGSDDSDDMVNEKVNDNNI